MVDLLRKWKSQKRVFKLVLERHRLLLKKPEQLPKFERPGRFFMAQVASDEHAVLLLAVQCLRNSPGKGIGHWL